MSKVIHFEIVGDKPEQLANFYSEALDWKIEKWEGPTDYWLVTTGKDSEPGIDGGIGFRSNPKEAALGYTVGVEDCAAAIPKVERAGGKIFKELHAVPGVGWMAYCTDIDGNVFGLMQEDTEAK